MDESFWESYRSYFPHLPSLRYFNHAAVSPVPLPAREAVEAYLRERSLDNIESWPEMLEQKQHFKEQVGRLIHARPENLAVSSGTALGLNCLAQGLDWQPGDRILLNNFEFPSNVYPFLNLQRRGVEVDFAEHRDGRILVEDLEAKVAPQTRLLSISFVEFLNGFRPDLAAVRDLCRRHDLIFCVDAIQGLGVVPLDVQELDIDFLACGGHKWLMWPLGAAFFYVSPRIWERLHPMAPGWLSVEDPWNFFDYRLDFLPTAERFETGNFNLAGVVGANASLKMFLEIGAERIYRRILHSTDYLVRQLQESGYELFTCTEPATRSGIVTFRHPRAGELHQYLNKERIHVSLRSGLIRVSPHFYNNSEDIDRLLERIHAFDHSKART